ncbi:MAG: cytochrome c maturation protein CcmE [Candidatus Neomarinimicrobiota bacterium]|nr:cytochrome c maturation protein CcmE [Candidatus Neomarinimicrobiota bacterium]
MNKKFAAVIISVALLMMVWVGLGFEGNELPYVTIQDLTTKETVKPGKRFRLGGNVKEGSIIRSETDPLALSFVLLQEEQQLPVSYHKIVPDMFKDGSEVIVEGIFNGERFYADNLMTKCASRYEGDLRKSDTSI